MLPAMVLWTACDAGSVLPDSTISGACEKLVSPAPGDHHNAGMGCMSTAGCHNAATLGGGAPPYSYAGTVYRDAAGTQPYPGATILITMGGTTTKLIAGTMGNFQISPQDLAAPTTAGGAMSSASACPSTVSMMTTALPAGPADCNSCHKADGTPGRIHIP